MNVFYFTILNLIITTLFVYGIPIAEECIPVNKLLKKEQSNDCCSEEGIKCDLDGHVIRIYIYSSNKIENEIPPELGNLSKLRHLELKLNKFSGPIPPELGNLSQLDYLDLSNNQFNGTIPSELGKLSNLTMLRLNDNKFTGSIPPKLGNLTKLTLLKLNNNQLFGTIPSELGYLSNLTLLNLSNNQFSGLIPPELEKLTNLKELDLSFNNFNGDLPKISNCKITTNGNQNLGNIHGDTTQQNNSTNNNNNNNENSTKIILIIVGVSALLLILLILAYFKIKNNNGNSHISEKKKYFEWKIENWNQLNDGELSFTFEANGHLWKLKLITNNFNEYNEKSVDVSLSLYDYIKDDESIYTNFVIYFRNFNNNNVFKEVEYDGKPTCYNAKSLTHGINDAILKSELYEKTNDECSLIEDNKIIIGILIKFY